MRQFLPDLVLTQFHFSGKTRPHFEVALTFFLIGSEANPVSNVLLSAFALLIGGLPETDAPLAQPGISVATVFQDNTERPVSLPLGRPRWKMASEQSGTIGNSVFRGQNPGGIFEAPPLSAPLDSPNPGYPGVSPFYPGQDPAMPYMNDPGQIVISGINGPQPHRLGFTPIFDATYIAPSSARGPGQGHLDVQEYNGALRHTAVLEDNWVFTNTAQGGARLWNGPDKPDLPGSVFRAGWDFTLNTPQVGPWGLQLDFNPSVNSDFQGALGRESLNLDGNITAFYRVSPQFMWVLGVQYWDRVDKIIIPNAGVVWNPNDRFEMRLLFPKSRFSYFLGNFGDASHWLYASGEYHVESYQIQMPGMSAQNQVQMSDWRVAVGLRSDHQWYDKFVEVGYVFGRHTEFLHSTPDFNLSNGIMARLGVQF